MSRRLHRTLESHRHPPRVAIRPAILATIAFLFVCFVAWVNGVIFASGPDVPLAVSPTVLLVGRAVALALAAWVAVDAWRGRATTGALGALVVAAVAVATLAGVFWYMTLLAGARPS